MGGAAMPQNTDTLVHTGGTHQLATRQRPPSGLVYSPSAVQNAATAFASPALNALVNASADLRTAAMSADSPLRWSPCATAAGGGCCSWAADRNSQPAAMATSAA